MSKFLKLKKYFLMKKLLAILGLGIGALLVIIFSGDNTGEDAKNISDKWHNIKKEKVKREKQ